MAAILGWQGQIAAPVLSATDNQDGEMDLILTAYNLETEKMWVERLSGKDGATRLATILRGVRPRRLVAVRRQLDPTSRGEQSAEKYDYEYSFDCDTQIVKTETGKSIAIHRGRLLAGIQLTDGEPAWKTIELGFHIDKPSPND